VLKRLIASGVSFSIATARSPATTLRMFEKIALDIPIILMNGVLIYDPFRKEYIKKEVLDSAAAEKIICAAHEAEQAALMYTLSGEEMFTYHERVDNEALCEFISERNTKYNKVFAQVDDFSNVSDDIIYFCFLDKQENIERIHSLIAGIDGIKVEKYRDIYSEELWYLEVFKYTASKYNAVEFLREYGGYEEIIGFGDNLNDIPLFHACDKCYAVANAKDELKEAATAVIGYNSDDGVAKWLAEELV